MKRTIPMWWIRHATQPYGARMEPRKKPDWQAPVKSFGHFHPTTQLYLPGDEKLPMGNLDFDEYQFFKGTPFEQGSFAECRLCEKSFFKREDRVAHRREKGTDGISCCMKIVAIMKLLQIPPKDHGLPLCIECDTPTAERKWGFPLCKRACVRAFMFDRTTDQNWSAAKELAEMRGWVK